MSQTVTPGGRERQHLILDGDDTLWENNVYFEEAIEEFLEFLDHSSLTRAEVRAVLDGIERANTAAHGYGAAVFARSLRECFGKLAERETGEADLARIEELGARVLRQPMVVLDGVAETVAYLAERHDLTLFTKGHPEEQRLKVERSGLERHFARIVVPMEKDPATYAALVAAHGLDPARTWMVGNSPRSDVNAALAAGLNAVYIPHPRTWSLEHQNLSRPGPGRLLTLDRFADLRRHF